MMIALIINAEEDSMNDERFSFVRNRSLTANLHSGTLKSIYGVKIVLTTVNPLRMQSSNVQNYSTLEYLAYHFMWSVSYTSSHNLV